MWLLIFFSVVLLWKQPLWWVLIKTIQFKFGIQVHLTLWTPKVIKMLKKLPKCWMVTFYGITKRLKSCQRLGKPRPQVHLSIRFTGCKNLGFKTTEKLVEKNNCSKNTANLHLFLTILSSPQPICSSYNEVLWLVNNYPY